MTTGREREWLGEWRDEWEARQQERQEQEERERCEPAHQLLDHLRRSRGRFFLLLKCEWYHADENDHLEEAGLPIQAFRSLAQAVAYRNTLPGRGEWEEPDPSGVFVNRHVPISHRIVEIPSGKGATEVRPPLGVVYIVSRQWTRNKILPLAAFLCREEAEGFKERCTEAYRANNAPFRGEFSTSTSMPEGVFRDWLLDLGIDPPPDTRPGQSEWRRWPDWWDKNSVALSDWQRQKVWQVLDKIQPYEVIAMDCEYA